MTERTGDLVPIRNGLEPSVWNTLEPVQKIQALYGESLDLCREYLLYRGNDRPRLMVQDRARHDVMMICAKFALETNRVASRNEVLTKLAEGLNADISHGNSSADHRNRNKPARRNSAKSLKS